MSKFQLVLLIHGHQPVGNFDDVFERCYAQSYLPFVDVLERHPAIHLGLHYSGPLLAWISRAHPDYFKRLRGLVKRGQAEIVGGGFYEPILVSIPLADRIEQITRLADYIEKHMGVRPTGAWLAERVWEPQIPSSLAPAGVEYTLVDDNHFLGAGFEMNQLHGYYLAEDMGHTVKVLPGLKSLRYLLPFRDPAETIQLLRELATAHPDGFAAMGDDLEKFGVWPGTNDLCYRDGWLEKFFTALEASSDWLEMATPSEAVSQRAPLGRADLPTASYTEMMEWSLPTIARTRYHDLVQEFSARPDALPFLRGGIWRNFFTKYSESNLLNKKMLHVSRKIERLAKIRRSDKSFAEARDAAHTLLLESQCNDAFWHGIFGGLYSPHLRTALWRALVEAESIADELGRRKPRYVHAEKIDFDDDGRDEIYFTSSDYAALLSPHDGGTISMLDFRPSNATLINSLMRRPEAYHAGLKHLSAGKADGAQSIHEQTRVKEGGLERWLHYDRWPRNCFRLLLFGQGKTYQELITVRLDEDAGLAGGKYAVDHLSNTRVALLSQENPDWPAEKVFTFSRTRNGFDVSCDITLRRNAPGAAMMNVGIETVVNFLAPSVPDRYFQSDGRRFPLRLAATASGGEIIVADEWQKVKITIEAPDSRNFWIAPIETVSESEDGFERIYQGSQVIAVWPVELAPGLEWKGRVTLKVTRLP